MGNGVHVFEETVEAKIHRTRELNRCASTSTGSTSTNCRQDRIVLNPPRIGTRPRPKRATIRLENLMGETVSTSTIDLQKGENTLSLPEPAVAGLYIVHLLDNNQHLWQGKWVRP